MKKVHLIKTGLNGSQILATAVIFNEENEFMETAQVYYNERDSVIHILRLLSIDNAEIDNAEVYEYHVRGGGIKRKK